MSTTNKIREARKARGMTLLDVATKVGVTTITVSEWERGVKTPRAVNAQRLIRVLPSLTLNKIYGSVEAA